MFCYVCYFPVWSLEVERWLHRIKQWDCSKHQGFAAKATELWLSQRIFTFQILSRPKNVDRSSVDWVAGLADGHSFKRSRWILRRSLIKSRQFLSSQTNESQIDVDHEPDTDRWGPFYWGKPGLQLNKSSNPDPDRDPACTCTSMTFMLPAKSSACSCDGAGDWLFLTCHNTSSARPENLV